MSVGAGGTCRTHVEYVHHSFVPHWLDIVHWTHPPLWQYGVGYEHTWGEQVWLVYEPESTPLVHVRICEVQLLPQATDELW